MSLTRESFVKFKPRMEEVKLPELGSVYVRELSANEVVTFTKSQASNPTDAIFRLVLVATVDENGDRLFADNDMQVVKDMSYQVVDHIANGILTVSGLKEDAKKKQIDASK